jgi:hypothetical protein
VTSQTQAALRIEELRPTTLATNADTDTTTIDNPIREEARRTYAEVLRRFLREGKRL